jgi:creatine kinase
MARFFDGGYYDSLSPDLQERLKRIVASGTENPDSQMGCYAMHPDDYAVFRPYLDQVIRAYHGIDGDMNQPSDWHTGALDLSAIDPALNDVSMRVRVGRNLQDFPLPGAMSQSDRVAMETRMVAVFERLMADPAFGGEYVSLTPGSPYEITPQRYEKLVAAHKMFKDMSADPYLKSAGISAHWPHGRGMYQSADGGFIIWVGEEDHLRIMAMQLGAKLGGIFTRLKTGLDMLAGQGLVFAHSERYGNVTSCPTNLGTGMRASLHLPLPKLTHNGRELSNLKAHAKLLGLSVRGVGGEHTEAGEGGIVDISPSARLMITEADIARCLYDGTAALMGLERDSTGS